MAWFTFESAAQGAHGQIVYCVQKLDSSERVSKALVSKQQETKIKEHG
jgi:hypothetical protein